MTGAIAEVAIWKKNIKTTAEAAAEAAAAAAMTALVGEFETEQRDV
jgi:hypothetical protein